MNLFDLVFLGFALSTRNTVKLAHKSCAFEVFSIIMRLESDKVCAKPHAAFGITTGITEQFTLRGICISQPLECGLCRHTVVLETASTSR